MKYDPVKNFFDKIFNLNPYFRIIFYKLLDLLLLRTWHIHKAIKRWHRDKNHHAIILDAGSGFGQYSYYISKLSDNYKIKGIDIKEEQIDECNRFFKKIGRSKQVTFQKADLTDYSDNQLYDLILSVDVMEHIENDIKVFEIFNKILKPDGMLLISTPSDKGGSDAHDEKDNSFIDEHVRNGYNINEIIEKLKKAGFNKIEANYSYGKPGKLSWILSMKYPLTLINLSKIFIIILPFYYLIVFPFCLILNLLDLYIKHPTGTGLIIKAYK
jgi:2-polyprenyl-3-methyl-5-hydroxy-6-metoxy-1,4-benzoquinol methylase